MITSTLQSVYAAAFVFVASHQLQPSLLCVPVTSQSRQALPLLPLDSTGNLHRRNLCN